MRVASLNMSGAERAGVWARFLRRCVLLVEKDRVDVVLGQEHNLHPSREGELMRWAESKGFALVIAFAPRGEDNVHRGGTLMLINLKTVDWPELKEDRAKRIVHSEPGAVVAEVGWNGRGILVGSVYAPAKPTPRLAFLQNMRKWASEDMYLGGDWNCVPDVTVDVQSSDPLRYRNTGGALLEDVTGDIGLMDFRRTQLGEAHEHTRMPLGVLCVTKR